jgi:hypothetical protein
MKKVSLWLLLSQIALSLNAASHSKTKYQFSKLESLKYSELIRALDENYFLEKTELLEDIADKRLSQKKLEKIIDKAIETFCKKYNNPLLPFDIKTTWKNKRSKLLNTLIQCSTFSYEPEPKVLLTALT